MDGLTMLPLHLPAAGGRPGPALAPVFFPPGSMALSEHAVTDQWEFGLIPGSVGLPVQRSLLLLVYIFETVAQRN